MKQDMRMGIRFRNVWRLRCSRTQKSRADMEFQVQVKFKVVVLSEILDVSLVINKIRILNLRHCSFK